MEKEFKGLIPTIMEMSSDANWLPPTKPFTIESFHEMVKMFHEQDEKRRKNGWKPEYILTNQAAEEYSLEMLQWLCNNYRVLCSLEASQILERKEKEHLKQ